MIIWLDLSNIGKKKDIKKLENSQCAMENTEVSTLTADELP